MLFNWPLGGMFCLLVGPCACGDPDRQRERLGGQLRINAVQFDSSGESWIGVGKESDIGDLSVGYEEGVVGSYKSHVWIDAGHGGVTERPYIVVISVSLPARAWVLSRCAPKHQGLEVSVTVHWLLTNCSVLSSKLPCQFKQTNVSSHSGHHPSFKIQCFITSFINDVVVSVSSCLIVVQLTLYHAVPCSCSK